MNNVQVEASERWFTGIALKAIKDDPKSKLYAKVNCADNFVLATFHLAHDAILDDIGEMFEPSDIEWYNMMCATKENKKTKFDAFIYQICLTAYNQLK